MLKKLFQSSSVPESDEQQADEQKEQLEFELEQIKQISDETELTNAAISASYTKARQAAAEKVFSTEKLTEIEKHSTDKSVQHIVREKIKALKAQDQSSSQAQDRVQAMCDKIEQLSQAEHSPMLQAQYEYLEKTWNAFDKPEYVEVKKQHEERFNVALEACKQIIEQQEAEAKAEQEKSDAETQAQEQEKVKKDQQELAKQQKAEVQAQEQAKSDEEKAEHDKQQSLLERSLLEQIEAIEKNLEQKITANISKKITSVQKKLDSMDTPLAKKHEAKVQRLKNQLNELKDWQSFAALPKKQELCDKMEKLIGSELSAQELSKKIKQLQGQWKDLKGGGNDEEQKLWDKFKELSDKAYEPCKEHFKGQAEVRAENLKQREKVCDELEKLAQEYNWESPDWKAIDKILETAKKDFHRFSPVDHKQQESIKKRYKEATSPLIDKLRPEQKKNEDEKNNLIEQVIKLQESDNLHDAIEKTKNIQQKWKQIGITRRHEDQKLWSKFREACDGIFSKRDAERSEAKEQLKQEIQQAESICSDIEALSKLSDDELKKSDKKYQELRKSFLDIDNLKKDKQKKLFNRFYKACDQYKNQSSGISKRKKQASRSELLRKALLCDQLECGENLETVENNWNSDISLDGESDKLINKRFEQAKAIGSGSSNTDHKENEKQRRLTLIQLEILLDKDTPDEDKSLRMEYQLTQLSNKGLSGGSSDKKQQMDSLITEWITSSAPSKESQAKLQERFEQLVS